MAVDGLFAGRGCAESRIQVLARVRRTPGSLGGRDLCEKAARRDGGEGLGDLRDLFSGSSSPSSTASTSTISVTSYSSSSYSIFGGFGGGLPLSISIFYCRFFNS